MNGLSPPHHGLRPQLWELGSEPAHRAGVLTAPSTSLQQGKMFFFIGLTMATIQGIYTRRIGPGREIAAVKRVRECL